MWTLYRVLTAHRIVLWLFCKIACCQDWQRCHSPSANMHSRRTLCLVRAGMLWRRLLIYYRLATARARSWRRSRRGDDCQSAVATGHQTFWLVLQPRARSERLTRERMVAQTIRVNGRTNVRNVRETPQGTWPRRRPGGLWCGAVTAAMVIAAYHGGHGLPWPNIPSRGHDPCVDVITACTRCQTSLPLVALPLSITSGHGSHGASQRARTVTACTAGAVASVAAGCEGTC